MDNSIVYEQIEAPTLPLEGSELVFSDDDTVQIKLVLPRDFMKSLNPHRVMMVSFFELAALPLRIETKVTETCPK